MNPRYLAIEAIVCALPSATVGSVGSLVFIYSAISMFAYDPLEAAKGIAIALGLILALFQFAILADRTVSGTRYKFGLLFWCGACFGLWGVWYAFNFFGSVIGAAIALPIVAAALHFIWLQQKRRRKVTRNAA